jgi:hypothetical protein
MAKEVHEQKRAKVVINGEIIEQVSKFKYLGCSLHTTILYNIT